MKTLRIVKSAFKELGKNKLRTSLMMLGIIIGITAVTMVMSVGLGAEKRVMSRVKKFGLESIMVFAGGGREMGRPSAGESITTLTLRDADAIKRQISAVIEVAPFNRKGNGMVKYQEISITTRIFGVTPTWAPVWNWYASQGKFINETDEARLARICVLGPSVQQDLFKNLNPIGEQIRIGNIPFEVVGIMEPRGTSPGGGDMDNRIYIPLSTFMRRVANIDYIYGIKIQLNGADQMQKTASSIKTLLREQHTLAPGEPDDFRIITPTEVTQFAEKVSGTFNIFLVLVAAISLIAGGFVITNIMLISVSERRHEIGLRKAIGANKKDIRFQFLLETMAITITSGLAGILLGSVGSIVLKWITQIPVSISWKGVVLGLLFSTIVGLIAGLQPAKRAAMLQPIEALRG